MPHPKKSGKKAAAGSHAHRPAASGQKALQEFAGAVEQSLAGLRSASQKIHELLGRWEQMADGAPGLLGGNLIPLVNEAVLDEQLERLSQNMAGKRREPADLADHADFFGGLLGEYAALLKVLAGIELDPQSALAGDWEKISDELLQHGAAIQQHAEQMEVELEGADEEEAGESGRAPGAAAAAGMHTVSRDLLQKTWEQAMSGVALQGEAARLAQVMRDHPEYRVAWESAGGASDRDYTIGGVNPFVHLTMHVAVESQLAEGEPPETTATLERLLGSGLSRHEAVHRIANVMVEQVWKMHRENRGFDRPAYTQALSDL